jgi:N-acetylneuraminate synthase
VSVSHLNSFALPGGRLIGQGDVYVIAEAGVNHNGSLDLALQMVDIAAEAGADAVKFQTFKSEALVTASAPKAAYQQEATGEGSQLEMLSRLELDEYAHQRLLDRCTRRGITFLSTSFEQQSADFLESLDVPAFKIPSGELTNTPLLAHVARKGRPMFVSTGMAELREVDAAVRCIRDHGNESIVLLHCLSHYPAPEDEVNLLAMKTMASKFACPIGYSDHTLGRCVATAAVALGACVIEKHFTVDRQMPGPDHLASIEPAELRALVSEIRLVSRALGNGVKRRQRSEEETARVARKSVVATRTIQAGAVITVADVAILRPGTGLSPAQLSTVIGATAARTIHADTPLTAADIS